MNKYTYIFNRHFKSWCVGAVKENGFIEVVEVVGRTKKITAIARSRSYTDRNITVMTMRTGYEL